MSHGESQELIEPTSEVFEFDEEARCALERGFEQNPAVVKELTKIVKEKEMDFLIKALSKMNEYEGLIVYDHMRMVYGQIAKRELERIKAEDEADNDITCGHTVDEHQEALRAVLEKTEPTIH